MYYVIEGVCDLWFSNSKLKNYVRPAEPLSDADKKDLIKKVIKEGYKDYVNKHLGAFVDIKEVNIKQIKNHNYHYDICVAKTELNAYFYKVSVKEIVQFVVKQINPYGLKGELYGYSFEVPLDALSVNKVIYNTGQNYVTVDGTKIKQNDKVRVKVTSVSAVTKSKTRKILARGTCKNMGLGKI